MKPRIGDIIEIQVRSQLAYALYTHEHSRPPRMGSLLRVLNGRYDSRPSTFDVIAGQGAVLSVFYPLIVSIKRSIFCIAAHVDLPAWAIEFPLFKNGVPDADGVIRDWWLWDGVNEWRVDRDDPRLPDCPELMTVNDTMLTEMIGRLWGR